MKGKKEKYRQTEGKKCRQREKQKDEETMQHDKENKEYEYFRTYLFGQIVSLLYGTLLCSIRHDEKIISEDKQKSFSKFYWKNKISPI